MQVKSIRLNKVMFRHVNWVKGFWQFLSACNHSRTPVAEGKCFCPDCGGGIVFHWVVVRCQGCRTRRESRYFLRQVIPAQSCCHLCGSDDFTLETLDNPQFYQLQAARLVAQDEGDYIRWRWEHFKDGLRSNGWAATARNVAGWLPA